MFYGIELTVLDFAWSILAIGAAVLFGLSARYWWVGRWTLTVFLTSKLGGGLVFSIFAVTADIDFDAAGYYVAGSFYAEMFRDFVTLKTTDFLQQTPFWWIQGQSTERFSSLSGVLLVITNGSFLGVTSIACSCGAAGQLLLYRYFRERFPEVRPVYFAPVLFHPSLMLWSGMLLKDTVGIFGLGCAVFSLHRLVGHRRLSAVVPFLFSLYTIFLFRYFVVLPLMAFSVFIVWDRVVVPFADRRRERWGPKVLYLMGSSVAAAVVLWLLVDRFGAGLIESRSESVAVVSQIEAGSTFDNVELSLSPRGVLALGAGAINSLFRPFPSDIHKPIQAVAAAENLAVLAFVAFGFHCYFRRLTGPEREHFAGVFWGMLVVVVIIAAGVGLFATNSGTISRYRIPMIPFLVAMPGLALGMADRFRRGVERCRTRTGRSPPPRCPTPHLA